MLKKLDTIKKLKLRLWHKIVLLSLPNLLSIYHCAYLFHVESWAAIPALISAIYVFLITFPAMLLLAFGE